MDTRTSYKIDIGNTSILNLGKLHKRQQVLDRMYEVIGADGNPMEKPAFEDVLDGTVTYKHKTLSAKTKVTKVDEFMKDLFDDFLGLRPNGTAVKVLESVGADKLAAIVKDRAKGKQPLGRRLWKRLADARKKLEARTDAVFADKAERFDLLRGRDGAAAG